MGTGKSTVGRLIASKLGYDFFDTDQEIVRKTGTQITEIFQKRGEETFRDLETETLGALNGREQLVISTGGGIVVRQDNIILLQELGFVALLTASENVIFERISRNTKRPLLQTANPRETMIELLSKRTPLYSAVTPFIFDTTDRSHQEVADLVIQEAEHFFSHP